MSLVRQATTDLLRTRRDLIILAARHRAKFEGWLKFELARALDAHPYITGVEPEAGYGNEDRCDIACRSQGGEYFLELKTSNTSWRAEGCPPKTRPITDNVGGVIRDIEKLRAGCKGTGGISVFLFFPVLHDQLTRIETEADLPPESLRKAGEFTELTGDFGVASFIVEVMRPRTD